MNEERIPPEFEADPVIGLLPWYVNGTLAAAEQRTVTAHLATCERCRAELESLTIVARDVRAASADSSEPSAQAYQTLLGRIGAPDAARSRPAAAAQRARPRSGWPLPRWAPAAASAVIVAQFGLLLWQITGQRPRANVSTRAVPAPATRFRILFAPTAREPEIRELLRLLHASIVGGPTPDGVYLIESPTTDPARVQQKLTLADSRRDLVRTIELVAP